jgi:hypothetical protein
MGQVVHRICEAPAACVTDESTRSQINQSFEFKSQIRPGNKYNNFSRLEFMEGSRYEIALRIGRLA